ncbi:hypothetical protein D3C76_583480 [compost metagenome]
MRCSNQLVTRLRWLRGGLQHERTDDRGYRDPPRSGRSLQLERLPSCRWWRGSTQPEPMDPYRWLFRVDQCPNARNGVCSYASEARRVVPGNLCLQGVGIQLCDVDQSGVPYSGCSNVRLRSISGVERSGDSGRAAPPGCCRKFRRLLADHSQPRP